MAISVFANKFQHRADNTVAPLIFTPGDYGANGRWKIPPYKYAAITGPLNFITANRTEVLSAFVRNTAVGSGWTVGTGVVEVLDPVGTYQKTGGDSFSGARAADVTSGNYALEMTPASIAASYAVMLQSGSFNYDPVFSTDVEHCMLLGQNGAGDVRERGVVKASFTWVSGDRPLIELVDGVVHYWIIKSDGQMVHIRSARSLMTYPVFPAILLYHTGSQASGVYEWRGVEASTTVQVWGVLAGKFQDWRNPSQLESLAEKTTTKDKKDDFTYFTEEKNLRTFSINLEWRFEEDYQEFIDFFEYHDISREFIFIDTARSKLSSVIANPALDPNEMVVRFVSAFKDDPLAPEMFGASVDLRQVIDSPVIWALA